VQRFARSRDAHADYRFFRRGIAALFDAGNLKDPLRRAIELGRQFCVGDDA
jgi:hypothetical protein